MIKPIINFKLISFLFSVFYIIGCYILDVFFNINSYILFVFILITYVPFKNLILNILIESKYNLIINVRKYIYKEKKKYYSKRKNKNYYSYKNLNEDCFSLLDGKLHNEETFALNKREYYLEGYNLKNVYKYSGFLDISYFSKIEDLILEDDFIEAIKDKDKNKVYNLIDTGKIKFNVYHLYVALENNFDLKSSYYNNKEIKREILYDLNDLIIKSNNYPQEKNKLHDYLYSLINETYIESEQLIRFLVEKILIEDLEKIRLLIKIIIRRGNDLKNEQSVLHHMFNIAINKDNIDIKHLIFNTPELMNGVSDYLKYSLGYEQAFNEVKNKIKLRDF
jgi:hypothetical protein